MGFFSKDSHDVRTGIFGTRVGSYGSKKEADAAAAERSGKKGGAYAVTDRQRDTVSRFDNGKRK